jgi:ribonucleoside-diphosphate reductase alpha chain
MDKLHRVVMWATEGLDADPSTLELQAASEFYDGMSTEQLHRVLIKTAANLVDIDNLDYDKVAARCAVYLLRKQVFGSYIPCLYKDFVKRMVVENFYTPEILEHYTDAELAEVGRMIDHSRDALIPYVGLEQLISKYLMQYRANDETKTGRIFETPQMCMMTIALTFKMRYDKEVRLEEVKKLYDKLSLSEISLPTPIMAGVRTNTKQFSSCVVLELDDSLDSVASANWAIMKYASQKAGLGINAGRIRALGDPIRGGDVSHTGVTPFYKAIQAALKSCSQGGVRGSAGTLFFPAWHAEFESIIVLKNNKGTEFNRVRQLDYGVQWNDHLMSKVIKGEDLYLYSPAAVPGMYDAFFEDPEVFEFLYESNIDKASQIIPARAWFRKIVLERNETSRIYPMNVDNVNAYGPYDRKVAPVRQSNLCMEIALPTKPLKDYHLDKEAIISLCTLAALNLGKMPIEKQGMFQFIEDTMDTLVRCIDDLLDYQDYPVEAARRGTMKYRPLGIGVINFAFALAKRGLRYSDGSANEFTNMLFEAMAYFGLKASMELAKEKGMCSGFYETKYARGIMPIDRYKRTVDDLVDPTPHMDWDSLRKDISQYGLRNTTILALMPSETSSQISGATSGIEPPRALISVKKSKDGLVKQIVPEVDVLHDKYELLWETDNIRGYIEIVAIAQKWVCQSISANTSYSPHLYENSLLPIAMVEQDLMYGDYYGVKTWYYNNIQDEKNEVAPTLEVAAPEEDDDCEGGACKI